MALSKRITLPSGIQTKYHRIVALTHVTNVQTTVEVASYTGRGKREDELAALAANEPMDVFIETQLLVVPYGEVTTVAEAYEWLKTTETFEGATDVLEAE